MEPTFALLGRLTSRDFLRPFEPRRRLTDVSEADQDFREVVAAHMERLRVLAYVTCGDWQLAEDAVAAVLSKMYPRWRRIEQPAAYARQAVVRAQAHDRTPGNRISACGALEELVDVLGVDAREGARWAARRAGGCGPGAGTRPG